MNLSDTYFNVCERLKKYISEPKKKYLFSAKKYIYLAPPLDGVVLGLSGGLDSALVASMAVDALGADRVTALFVPGKYTLLESETLAFLQAQRLGIKIVKIPLDQTVPEWLKNDIGKDYENSIPVQNFVSRSRSAIINTYANVKNLLTLSPLNRTEIELGYFTLGGDSSYFHPMISNLPKTVVKEIAIWRNSHPYNDLAMPILQEIIDRPPNPELAFNQTDEGDLGCSYEEIDYYIGLTNKKPKNFKYNQEMENKLKSLVRKNKFKKIFTNHLNGEIL